MNEIVIRYAVTVDTGITSLANVVEISVDADSNGNFDDPGEAAVARATSRWPATAASASVLPQTGFAPGKLVQLPFQQEDEKYASYDGLVLEIPSLHVKTDIVGVQQYNQGWNITWLDNQAGWLAGSAFPTWTGNSVITGHVWNANNQPGIFQNLRKLSYGDTVLVHAYGSTYVYEIRDNRLVSPANITSAFEHKKLSWITLLTCENYDEKSDAYLYRRIVQAVLVRIE